MTTYLDKGGEVEMISVPIKAITDGPSMQWNHIDGPLMHWAGQMHWLTWRERLALLFRRATVEGVAKARFPHLEKLRRHYSTPQPNVDEGDWK